MKKILCSIFFGILIAGPVFAGTITVKSPQGSETWLKGQNQNIVWESTGLSKPVTISLWRNKSYLGLIVKDRPSSGLYKWRVGYYQGGEAVPGPGYQIRIQEQDVPAFAAIGQSKKGFSIKEPVSMKHVPASTSARVDPFKMEFASMGNSQYKGALKFSVQFKPTLSVETANKELNNNTVSFYIDGTYIGKRDVSNPITSFDLPAFQVEKLHLLPGWHRVEAKVIISRARGSEGFIKGEEKFNILKGDIDIQELTPNMLSIYEYYDGKLLKKTATEDSVHHIGETFLFSAKFTEKGTDIPLKGEKVFFRYIGSIVASAKTNDQGIARFEVKTNHPYGEPFSFYIGSIRMDFGKPGPNWCWANNYDGWNFSFEGNTIYNGATDLNKVVRHLRFCPTGKTYNASESRCYD